MKRNYLPDPKPEKRTKNKKAGKLAVLAESECVICGDPSAHAHHLVYRSQDGDDVPQNLVGLCSPCHDRIHKADTVVLLLLGDYLIESRPDFIDYLTEKFGGEGAKEWMMRRLYTILNPVV